MVVRRVVVTGMGLVTPLGCGVENVWTKVLAGKSGFSKLEDLAYQKLPCRVAGLIPQAELQLVEKFSDSDRRSASTGTLYALIATEEAIKSSNLDNEITQEVKERIGVAMGMGMMDLQDVQDTGDILKQKGYSRVSPYFIPRILPNLAAGQISIKYGFQGPNHCASTACASGAHAIGDAFNLIRYNVADVMVCGGTEACINPLSIAAFCRLRALSTKFNSEPLISSRPFDADRDGFVMGEGAGALVLEELQSALNRGATIYGEVIGYGLTGDGHHMTAAREDGHGAYRAMKMALDAAQLRPDELNYVNCHATSTPIGDKAEIRALRRLFNSENVNDVAISSTKGSHGHLLGAAGAVETILTIMSCYKRVIPPSVNIINLDKYFERLNIVTTAFPLDVSSSRVIALKNSFGFGGTNASLCISSYV